ncbi:MAG: class III poly(R)-hydroxyalkanoic acid synthase subunit PhaE [Rhodanobacteraceae bacterium]|nr:class III poly(R)-hydroxyalkanoic acid synthase subunit PhaE [Xanthomonadales bacterium]MCP5478569.1 class III poly(R)-hydroxyalkanoic acid synthase subunit PhaE [Rhodanobacteraceae bacterium]HPF73217.1 class III poly(R)-hydroxyalkanoic acid synthase subunit PhaE [Xanthomonadaceae bacterium]HRX99894.1 class III poly(R)-hydroxyalkanoic acid synthase subunit PhaE [Xanthomonadaceae bacterium]
MNASHKSPFGDFSALMQRFWDGLGQARHGASAAAEHVPGFQRLAGLWSSLAGGGNDAVESAADRLSQQAGGWLTMMQQLAERFAGQQVSAGGLAGAWKDMLKGANADPFSHLFRMASGHGASGLHGLGEMPSAANLLQPMLAMPAFGFAREHQERWQRLMQASMDVEQARQRYFALLSKGGERAFSIFEDLLAERSEPGRQMDTARALFDLWIDAAEQGYAEVALSREFREVYGELVNAQMRQRAGIQKEVELQCRELGMPTRSELDGSHRKVIELQRELRRLSRRLEALEGAAGATSTASEKVASPTKTAAAKRAAKKPSVKPATAKKAQPSASGRKSVARVPAKKGPAKKAVGKAKASATGMPTPKAPAKAPAGKPARKSAAARTRK